VVGNLLVIAIYTVAGVAITIASALTLARGAASQSDVLPSSKNTL
jgi:hypothetical protein